MSERGNTTHGRRLDEEMKLETDGLTRNAVPDRTQAWRQPEPLPDDTDADEVLSAMEPNGVFGSAAPFIGGAPGPIPGPRPIPGNGPIPAPGQIPGKDA